MKSINIGVPQDSILGPLLYVLYVNDFQYAVDCIPRLYADDTCLVIQGKTAKQLFTEFKNDKSWTMDVC